MNTTNKTQPLKDGTVLEMGGEKLTVYGHYQAGYYGLTYSVKCKSGFSTVVRQSQIDSGYAQVIQK